MIAIHVNDFKLRFHFLNILHSRGRATTGIQGNVVKIQIDRLQNIQSHKQICLKVVCITSVYRVIVR